MKLLTESLKKKIPPLYAQDGKGDNATVYAKFFCPWNSWTWYVTEYDPKTNECFGFVSLLLFLIDLGAFLSENGVHGYIMTGSEV